MNRIEYIHPTIYIHLQTNWWGWSWWGWWWWWYIHSLNWEGKRRRTHKYFGSTNKEYLVCIFYTSFTIHIFMFFFFIFFAQNTTFLMIGLWGFFCWFRFVWHTHNNPYTKTHRKRTGTYCAGRHTYTPYTTHLDVNTKFPHHHHHHYWFSHYTIHVIWNWKEGWSQGCGLNWFKK